MTETVIDVSEIDAMIFEREIELRMLRALKEKAGRVQPAKLLSAPRRKNSLQCSEPPRAMDEGASPEIIANDDDGNYVVNGRKLKLSDREIQVMDLLAAAPEGNIVPVDDLAGLFGGMKSRMYPGMNKLNLKLAAANATAASQRGLGYRLENL